MVLMLGRPCAFFTTSSGANPCSRAQPAHTRATAGVESTKTPSKSKSTPRQRMLVMIYDRQKAANCEIVESEDWGGRRGLNPRHSVPQTDALPAELLPPSAELL